MVRTAGSFCTPPTTRRDEPKLTLIGKVKDFTVVRYHTVPDYEFRFMGTQQNLRVVVSEKANGENRTLSIPYEIAAE